MYVRFPLSLRNVGNVLFERGIDSCHETVRLWRNRFGRCRQPALYQHRQKEYRFAADWVSPFSNEGTMT